MLTRKSGILAGRFPDFIVVGATKAGTTSLDYYLSLHPEIHMASPKEPGFFVDGIQFSNRHRGLDWYKSLFVSAKPLCGESTPSYTHWPSRPLVAERMRETIPLARLVYIVREPWARIQSHCLMNYRTGRTNLPFAEYLVRSPHLRDATCYGTQLANLLRHFPAEQILVIESDRLQRETRAVLHTVFHFLGANPDFDSPLFDRRLHVGNEKRIPNAWGRRLLVSPPLQFLRKHLSPWWYHQVQTGLTWPFLGPIPEVEIAPGLRDELTECFRREVDLLRQLTNQELASLEVKPPN